MQLKRGTHNTKGVEVMIGRNVKCLVEKDGEKLVAFVRWTHAVPGNLVKIKTYEDPDKIPGKGASLGYEITDGWTVVDTHVDGVPVTPRAA